MAGNDNQAGEPTNEGSEPVSSAEGAGERPPVAEEAGAGNQPPVGREVEGAGERPPVAEEAGAGDQPPGAEQATPVPATPAVAATTGGEETPAPKVPGEPHPTGPALRRWLLPLLLAVVCVGTGSAAVALDARDATLAAPAEAGPRPATPVLSARRAPELLAAPVADRRLRTDLAAWIAQSPPGSCLVVAKSGDVAFEHQPTTPLPGASTQKLLTATGLLEALGPDARLETTVRAAAPASGGILRGDLYLVGGGDPILGTQGYADQFSMFDHEFNDIGHLADAIRGAGITRIEGAVVGDDTRYDVERFHPAWPARFQDQRVTGPLSALALDDGFANPGARLPAPDPAANAAAVLTRELMARGVAVAGSPRSGRAPGGLIEVASLPSLPISGIVAEMLTESDNETAELALKEIGRDRSGEGSWAQGVAGLQQLLVNEGVPLDGVRIVDGSGLSDQNRVTCRLLISLLTNTDHSATIRRGLAVAGQTGTLTQRWDGTPVEGRLRAKTGSLRRVTALAGQIEPLRGGTMSFAYIATVPEPLQLDAEDTALQEGLADILVNYPRSIDVGQLVPQPPTTG